MEEPQVWSSRCHRCALATWVGTLTRGTGVAGRRSKKFSDHDTLGARCLVVLVKCLAVWTYMDNGYGFLHVLKSMSGEQ